jgi:hypothetical protein
MREIRRWPDPYKPSRIVNEDRELGPGGMPHGGISTAGDPLAKVEDRRTGHIGASSPTKPGVVLKWR